MSNATPEDITLDSPTDPDTETVYLQGGIAVPTGYTLVGSVSEDEDFNEQDSRVLFDDLLPIVTIEQRNGISVSLEQLEQGSPNGALDFRLIADMKARVYLFRMDANGVTSFKVELGNNVD